MASGVTFEEIECKRHRADRQRRPRRAQRVWSSQRPDWLASGL